MTRKLHEFESKVLTALRAADAAVRGERLLLAVSGGADSMALLHAVSQIAPVADISIAVAHLDHELRGAESAADAEFVRVAARRLGVPAAVGAQSIARRRGESLEAAARRVRYAFLERAAAELVCARIATGHTANDQAETVLLRILRGAGPAGLSGVRARRRVAGGALEIVRPLLDRSREEILAYLAEIGASHRTDSTNASLEPLRNRVRHEILPLAESLVNPRAVHALARFASRQAEIDCFLEAEAARVLPNVVVADGAGWIALEAASVAVLAPALAPLVLRLACAHASTEAAARALEETHIAALRELATGASGRQALSLPAPLEASRVGDRIVITGAPDTRGSARRASRSDESETSPVDLGGRAVSSDPHAFHAWLDVPGEVALAQFAPAGRSLIRAARVPRPHAPIPGSPAPFAVEFDWERVAPPLEVRSRRAGDRIAPRGMLGRKSLQDLFVDRKIPWTERHLVPVVVDQRRVLWVVGLAASREAAVSETTREALVLAFSPIVPAEGNR